MKRIRVLIDVMMTDKDIERIQGIIGSEPIATIKIDKTENTPGNTEFTGRFIGAQEARGEH